MKMAMNKTLNSIQDRGSTPDIRVRRTREGKEYQATWALHPFHGESFPNRRCPMDDGNVSQSGRLSWGEFIVRDVYTVLREKEDAIEQVHEKSRHRAR